MANHEIMMDRGETQSKPVNFINRKIAALTVAGSMLLGGAGCADRMITTDTSGEITPASTSENVTTNGTTSLSTSEVIVTPEDTSGTKITANTEATDPKVTVKPTTTVGTSAETQYVTQTPTETTTAISTPEVLTDEELLAEMPNVEGLEKNVVDGIGKYTAVEGNKFGLEKGEYAGIYKEEVYEINEKGEETKTGAVALVASVVEVLLEEQIPTSKNGYLMPLAADLSDSDLSKTDKIYISIDAKGTMVDNSLPYLIDTDCGGKDVDVANIIPGKTVISQSGTGETGLHVNQSQLNWDVDETDYDNQMAFLTTYVLGQENLLKTEEPIDFGTKIGTTNQRILQNMGCARGSTFDFESYDNVLDIDGKPVSLIVNK